MRLAYEHRWDVTPAEGMEIQRQLAQRVVAEDRVGDVRTVAGADMAIRKPTSPRGASGIRGYAHAAAVVLDFPSLTPLESNVTELPLTTPYIPGLLTFREAPAIIAALDGLSALPDLLIIDGHGVAHPRRFGIAAHLGVLLDIATIGCAKSRLVGAFEEPGLRRGDWSPLLDGNEVIGAVLRTREGVKPVFVSIGNKVDLPTAIRYVLACCTRYRLPETTRWAHRIAGGDKLPFVSSADSVSFAAGASPLEAVIGRQDSPPR